MVGEAERAHPWLAGIAEPSGGGTALRLAIFVIAVDRGDGAAGVAGLIGTATVTVTALPTM